MIIWQGAGILIGLLGFISLILTQYAVNAVTGDNRYYQNHGWPKLLGMVIAAAVRWPAGRAMNRGEERTVVDPNSGEPVVVHSGGGHSLFFVPVQYWWAVFLVLGVVFALMERPEAAPGAAREADPKEGRRR